ncbi:MAG: glycosyltransferase, partial [Verrucomicrobiota bacterium]
PTFNPDRSRLRAVIEAALGYAPGGMEIRFVVVDNKSEPAVRAEEILVGNAVVDLIREPRPGTAFARIAGLRAVRRPWVLYLDDDNLVTEDYFAAGFAFLSQNPTVGVVGGRILPHYESDPPKCLEGNEELLALRDFDQDEWISGFDQKSPTYPDLTPLTAGLLFRREVVDQFLEWVDGSEGIISGRIGEESLGASEDCEFLMQGVYLPGLQSGYCHRMTLKHIIPTPRMEWPNLKRTAFEGGKAWGAFERKYDLRPRQPLVFALLRIAKHFFGMGAWKRRGRLKWLHYAGRTLAHAKY